MKRFSWSGRDRGRVGLAAHRALSGTLVALLVVMAAGTAAFGHAPAAVRARAAMPVTASVTPATALLYFAVDLDTSSAQYQKSAELLKRFGSGTTVQGLVGNMTTGMTGGNATATAQLTALLGGEAGIAIFGLGSGLSLSSALRIVGTGGNSTPGGTTGGTGAQSNMAVIISAPDPNAAYSAAETALKQDATSKGTTVSAQTYGGVQIQTVAGDQTTGSTGSALARVGKFIVLGSAATDVEPVIDTQSGKTPSLANSTNFKNVAAELNSDWLVLGHVNGTEMANQVRAAASSGASVSGMSLNQLNGDTGFVVWADNPGFHFDSITVPSGTQSTSPAANFQAVLPSKVPANTLFLTDGADLGKTGILDTIILSALATLSGAVGTGTPVASLTPAERDQQFAQLQSVLGFNIKTDFIDQLVGEWGIAAWGASAGTRNGQGSSGFRLVLVSNAQTPATVSKALAKLSTLFQSMMASRGTVTTKQIGQDQVSVLTLKSTTGGQATTIEYGIVGGVFIFSVGDAISEYLASGTSTLANNPNYRDALAVLPAQHNGIFFLNLEATIGLVQSSLATSLAGGTPTAGPSSSSALKSIAGVTYERNGMTGVSALLLIKQ